MRYHNVTRSGRVRNLEFNGFLPSLGRYLYHLSVIEAELFCVRRVHDHRACSFSFVPGRIPHVCIGVVVDMSAGRPSRFNLPIW